MWVEIVLFNAEGGRNFTTLVHLVVSEHGLASHVFNDVVCLGVSQVTSLVNWLPLLIVFATILVL